MADFTVKLTAQEKRTEQYTGHQLPLLGSWHSLKVFSRLQVYYCESDQETCRLMVRNSFNGTFHVGCEQGVLTVSLTPAQGEVHDCSDVILFLHHRGLTSLLLSGQANVFVMGTIALRLLDLFDQSKADLSGASVISETLGLAVRSAAYCVLGSVKVSKFGLWCYQHGSVSLPVHESKQSRFLATEQASILIGGRSERAVFHLSGQAVVQGRFYRAGTAEGHIHDQAQLQVNTPNPSVISHEQSRFESCCPDGEGERGVPIQGNLKEAALCPPIVRSSLSGEK